MKMCDKIKIVLGRLVCSRASISELRLSNGHDCIQQGTKTVGIPRSVPDEADLDGPLSYRKSLFFFLLPVVLLCAFGDYLVARSKGAGLAHGPRYGGMKHRRIVDFPLRSPT